MVWASGRNSEASRHMRDQYTPPPRNAQLQKMHAALRVLPPAYPAFHPFDPFPDQIASHHRASGGLLPWLYRPPYWKVPSSRSSECSAASARGASSPLFASHPERNAARGRSAGRGVKSKDLQLKGGCLGRASAPHARGPGRKIGDPSLREAPPLTRLKSYPEGMSASSWWSSRNERNHPTYDKRFPPLRGDSQPASPTLANNRLPNTAFNFLRLQGTLRWPP